MNQLNSIILEGNLVRQAEMSEPAKGFRVCKFPLAVNRFSKSQNGDSFEEVSYFDVEAYGKVAEICEKQGLKGRGIRVVGRLKQSRWKDNDGKTQSKIFVIAEHVEYRPVFQKEEEHEKRENNKLGHNDSGEASSESQASAEVTEEDAVF